jgi:hypothetical protein
MQLRSFVAAFRHFVLGILHSWSVQLVCELRLVCLRECDSSAYPSPTFVSPLPLADRGVIVKRINFALITFATFASILTLAGCGDDKQIAEVKALAFSYPNSYVRDPNLTVDQALDTRKLCGSVKWSVDQTDRNQTFVEYKCDYKDVSDSGFIEHDKSDVTSAGDVYQWTYGTDGQPELSYVGLVLHYKNGSSKDFKLDATSIMRVAVDNNATNFDQAWSVLRNLPIPIKPASPLTDTTYGNTLAALYPDHSALEAAKLAYLWKGVPVTIFGIDKLGYPLVAAYPEQFKQLFPVNPADVQIARSDTPSPQAAKEIIEQSHLSPDKLLCLSDLCFNSNAQAVGGAPTSILAQETASDGSKQQASAAVPAADPVISAAGDDGWPKMTPCIQKLDDAFVKDAQAKGIDPSVNMEQMQEWAATCKALGQ